MRILIIYILISLSITACSKQGGLRTVFVRDTIVSVRPPVIIDSGRATTVTDTVVSIVRLHNADTVVNIRYLPKPAEFHWRIQPDTVTIRQRDTIYNTQIIERPIEGTIWTDYKFLLALAGAIVITYLITSIFQKR